MITEDVYVGLIADLFNKHSDPKERERRVRDANQKLYRAAVSARGTDTQADLALTAAALKVRANDEPGT